MRNMFKKKDNGLKWRHMLRMEEAAFEMDLKKQAWIWGPGGHFIHRNTPSQEEKQPGSGKKDGK